MAFSRTQCRSEPSIAAPQVFMFSMKSSCKHSFAYVDWLMWLYDVTNGADESKRSRDICNFLKAAIVRNVNVDDNEKEKIGSRSKEILSPAKHLRAGQIARYTSHG